MLRHHADSRQHVHVADPAESSHVEIDVRSLCQLIERQRVLKDSKGRTSAGSADRQVVGGDTPAGTGHVLDHNQRISRNEPPEMARKEPRIGIVAAAHSRTDDKLDLLALKEIRWRSVCRTDLRGRNRNGAETQNASK